MPVADVGASGAPVRDPATPAALAAQTRAGVKGLRDTLATVRVPATSANLGPGFDSLGLALGVHDVVRLGLAPSGLEVTVRGQGAGVVPLTEAHLVVRAVRLALDHVGVPQPGLRLHCENGVPHGRGLGSSAAAVVAGLVAARGLLESEEMMDDEAVLSLATHLEGHPDNAAAALLGGCTVSWTAAATGRVRAERIEVHPSIGAVVCVPAGELSTRTARSMLPARVPHADAAFNAARAALLVQALGHRPDLLMDATEDRLHQLQRAPAMPATAELVAAIRAAGGAAVVSGAGPSVLVLGGADAAVAPVSAALARSRQGWTVLKPDLDTVGASLATESQ